MSKYFNLVTAASAALLSAMSAAAADPVEDFYKTHDVTIIVPYAAGGSTALQAQAAVKYFSEYIPGKPNVRVQYMPGAGGLLAVNFTYLNSPRDGTVLIYADDTNVAGQYLNPQGAKFDVRKFNWLGSVVEYQYVLAINKAAGIRNVDDLKTKEVFIASNGVAAANHIFPTITNAMLGTKMKVVPGYPGGAPEVYLALTRGEMQGYTTNYWLSQQPVFQNFNPILTFGLERSLVLPNVTTLLELVTDPDDRAAVKFASLMGSLGRGFAAMPDVPQDRVQALRRAFDKIAVNPGYLAEITATGTGEEIRRTPLTGEQMQKQIIERMDIGPDVISRLQNILAER
jgi:tripartite-type tricarboxylate transporter receptor subunit TctC